MAEKVSQNRVQNYYMSAKIRDGLDNSYSNSIPDITCYICDIDVPSQYFSEHKASYKHRMYLEVVNCALKRIQRNINQELPEAKQKSSTEYFCEQCVCIVKNENKTEHDNSKSHILSIMYERLMSDLLKIYIGDGDDKKGFSDVELIALMLHNDSLSRSLTERKKSEFLAPIREKLARVNVAENLKKMIEEKEKHEEMAKIVSVTQKKVKLERYLEMIRYMSLVSPIQTYKAIGEDTVEVTAINGDKVRLPVNNFHSFTSYMDGVICNICPGKELLQENDIEKHKFETEHMKRLMQPIEHMHCMRMFDLRYHCGICNIMITHSEMQEHAMFNGNHYATLKEMQVVKPPEQPQEKPNEIVKKAHCNICNITVTIDDLLSHLQSAHHKKNLKQEQEPIIVKSSIVEKHHFIEKCKDNTVLCKLCKTKIPNTTSNIQDHVRGMKHSSNITSLLIENKLIKSGNGFFCNVCQTKVPMSTELDHVLGKRHAGNLKQKPQSNSVQSSLSSMSDDYCYICQVEVTKLNMPSHVSGRQHQSKLENKSNHHCNICDVIVPCNPGNIKTHYEGSNHYKNLNKILTANKVKLTDSGKCYCELCKITFTKPTLVFHVKTQDHIVRMMAININKLNIK